MGWYDLRVGLWIVVVRPAGIEPTLLVPETSVLSVELRALRLYSGTPGGIRTHDPLFRRYSLNGFILAKITGVIWSIKC